VRELRILPLFSNSSSALFEVKYQPSPGTILYMVQYCIDGDCENTTFTGDRGFISFNCTGQTEVIVFISAQNRCGQMSSSSNVSEGINCVGESGVVN
jgi:hypothetical protein